MCFTTLCEIKRLKTHTSEKKHIFTSLWFSHTNTEWYDLRRKGICYRRLHTLKTSTVPKEIYFSDIHNLEKLIKFSVVLIANITLALWSERE